MKRFTLTKRRDKFVIFDCDLSVAYSPTKSQVEEEAWEEVAEFNRQPRQKQIAMTLVAFENELKQLRDHIISLVGQHQLQEANEVSEKQLIPRNNVYLKVWKALRKEAQELKMYQ